jgi:hypothetical protein
MHTRLAPTAALRPRPWVLAGVALAGAVTLRLAPDLATSGPVWCPFRVATGCDCPLCGATRASAALLHGRFVAAAGYNALAVALAPMVLWAWWLDARGRLERSRHPFRSRRFWYAALGTALAFTVLRNLPWEPWRALRS